jgi:dihydrofolate synthase/folylpolyglutamate synthase
MMRWDFVDSEAVFKYLMGFVNVEKGQKTEFKLDRMRSLCEALGHPERAYRTIHVAGSKGKGSVSVMTARILEARGLKTGLYTSPHLIAWKERISLAGDEMPEDIILAAMDELMPLVDGKGPEDFVGGELPTYFELTTLVGFLAFRLAGCDAAVIETGMGGRLDSTNVIDSALSVITPIELEHTEWLGDTIPKIAFEKAGIIKPGKPCIVSHQRPEALEVFRETCASRNSSLIDVEVAAAIDHIGLSREGTMADIVIPGDGLQGFETASRYRTPLVGSVQAENMALAILAARELEPGIGPEEARSGLEKSRLPARFEVLDAEPAIVLDGAHTPASIALCLESFNSIFPGPADLVFACAYDKKHGEMAKILDGRFRSVTITKPGNFKQSEPERVAASFGLDRGGCRLIGDTEEALAQARKDAQKAGIPLLIAGSFYLCSEAARLFAESGGLSR